MIRTFKKPFSGLSVAFVAAAMTGWAAFSSPLEAQENNQYLHNYGSCGVFLLDASISIKNGYVSVNDGRSDRVDPVYDAALDEVELQKQGYIDAFSDPRVRDAVLLNKPFRFLFLTYNSRVQEYFYGPDPGGWITVKDDQSYDLLLSYLQNAKYHTNGGTYVMQAMMESANRLKKECGIKEPFRYFVDVSGDGIDTNITTSSYAGLEFVRDMSRYIHTSFDTTQFNGLLLLTDPSESGEALASFYNENVRSVDGFQISVLGWENFVQSLKLKLIMEVAGHTEEEAASILAADFSEPEDSSYAPQLAYVPDQSLHPAKN